MRYSALLPLWPVALVWAFLVLPYLAYTARSLLDQQVIELPWYFTWPLRGLIRLPVYRKIAWMGQRMAVFGRTPLVESSPNSPNSPAFIGPRCFCDWHRPGKYIWHSPSDFHCPVPTCQRPLSPVSERAGGSDGQDQLVCRHLLEWHFPGEERVWEVGMQVWAFQPPYFTSIEQAQDWLDRRTSQPAR